MPDNEAVNIGTMVPLVLPVFFFIKITGFCFESQSGPISDWPGLFQRFLLKADNYIRFSGGIENNNKAVDDYIGSDEVSVRKLIAGKDIEFSSSIVEAQNKIIKYRYFFKHDFKDIHELRNLLSWIISDYHYERPHYSLNGLTPYEALAGKNLPKEQWHRQILDARRERLIQNVKERCEIC